MNWIIKSLRLGTRSGLLFVIGLLRDPPIKHAFRNWLVYILMSARPRSTVLTDLEEQSNPYQMAQRLMHVRIDCRRHKAVLSCTTVNIQKAK